MVSKQIGEEIKMPAMLRFVLLISALATAIYILHKIKRAKVKMEDAIFWVAFAFVLSILGLIPQISYYMSSYLGIQSPANFVYLMVLFLLIEKMFTMSIKISQLEDKIEVLTAEVALRTHEENKRPIHEEFKE